MLKIMLKSKIHNARVTDSDLNYDGSLEIDENLLNIVDIIPYERIDVYNITNGNRFSTYAIKGKAGSGVIGVKGAASHLAKKDDRIIITAYCHLNEEEAKNHNPQVVHVDKSNKF